MDTPRIYIADLSAYNAGRLVGWWCDIDDAEALEEAYRKASHDGAQDYAIHDTDGPSWFADLIDESTPLETVTALAEVLEEVGDDDGAFGAWLADDSYRVRELAEEPYVVVEQFREAYAGTWDSLGEYAYELATDTAPDPETRELMTGSAWPFSCINWDRAGEELRIGGDVWTAPTSGGCIYVFRSY